MDEPQLHWFWKLTTKWWFFPVFYLILALLSKIFDALTLASTSDYSFWEIFVLRKGMWITLLGGLSYYILLPIDLVSKIPLDIGLNLIFIPITLVLDVVMLILMIYIPYCKIKRNIIPKKLIISLFFVLILSFFGYILHFILPLDIRKAW